MAQTFTNAPVIPKGYKKLTFNDWQLHLAKERDKLLKTNVAAKLKA